VTPVKVKVHRCAGSGQLIEFRTQRMEQPAVERIARRLRALSAVSTVAFRNNGIGGWLVGHHGAAASPSEVPIGPGTPCEAA